MTTPRAAMAALLLLLVACTDRAPLVVLATTTSVSNSGLLDRLLPAYPVRVRTVAVGSGRALAMLADRTADVVITHAPEGETVALREHPSWWYRKVLYNDFVIVGPANDPASVSQLADASAAMKRLSDSGQTFISRGDDSGTHERERQLWKAAGVVPSNVVIAGASMGQTLRTASATKAYTLTDRGTFEALASSLELRVLVSGDSRLLNTYAVIADPKNEQGIRFARWQAEGEGRRVLAALLTKKEVRGFTLWPERPAGTSPDARPY